MIENERQYRITKIWVERFQQARRGVEDQASRLHPRALQAFRDQYDSEIEILQAQIAEYEKLRDGGVAVLELYSLSDLPGALISARIASGLTQKAFAERLGLKEQQIQRYEKTRYAGASLARLIAVCDALGITIHQRVLLPIAEPVTLLPAGKSTGPSSD